MDPDSLDEALRVVKAALPSLYAHMEEEGDLEAVGLVWSDSTISRLINQARSSHRFSVSKALFMELMESVDLDEKYPVSFYHSHPGGSINPSTQDLNSIKRQFYAGIHIPWVVVTPFSGWSINWVSETTLPASKTFPHPFGIYAVTDV